MKRKMDYRNRAAFIAALSISFMANAGHAVVTPIIIRLQFGLPAYVVPAGKTLIVKQITYESGSANVPSKITISSAASTNNFFLFEYATNNPSPAKGTVRLKETLAIPSGYTVEAATSSIFEGYYSLFGYLADPGDLYASVTGAIPSTISNLAHDGTNSSIYGTAASPRPSRITLQKSNDLQLWDYDPSASAVSLSTTEKRVDALAASERSFYRTSTHRRED